MSTASNVRASRFAFRELFEAEPNEGFSVASLSMRELANRFCAFESCDGIGEDGVACRSHSRAMMIGASKMVIAGDLHGELSPRGVLFVRLSPAGALSPLTWSSTPDWFNSRPDLVRWALDTGGLT